MDATDPVGVASDKGGGVNACPPQMSSVGAGPDDVGAKRVQQMHDFVLGFEDTTDMGVVQRAQTFTLHYLTDDPAVFEGERESVLVEVRAHGRLSHSRRYSHRRNHGSIQAERDLVGGEPLCALDLLRDVDRLIER